MAIAAIPYISFPGNARDALEFYQSVFGGDLELVTYGDLLDKGVQFPFAVSREAIAHSALTGLMNLTGGDDIKRTGSRVNRGDFGFTVAVETLEEGKDIAAKLIADGGRVVMPFNKAPWDGHFGIVEDKFGVAWNIDGDF